MFKKVLVIEMIVLFVFANAGFAIQTYRPVVRGMHWAITSRNFQATQAGAKIFEQGGNAIDAEIATLATLGVTEPGLSGLGGEAFFLIYDPNTKKVVSINGGGTAPYAATIEWFNKNQGGEIPTQGSILCAVTPGAFDAWIVALDNYGTMSLKEVLASAIELAEQGFPVPEEFCETIRAWGERLEPFENAKKLFFKADGSSYKPGDIFVNKDLADVMKRLVEAEQKALSEGKSRGDALQAARDHFYKGDIAKEFVEFSQAYDGLFSEKDLADYQAKLEEPVHTNYRGYEIYKNPSNNQGPAELVALNIIEGFDVKTMGHNSPEAIHVMVEAINLAMADREKYLGDMDFIKIPFEGLLSKDYAAERRKLIDPNKTLKEYPYGDPSKYTASAGFMKRNVVSENEWWSSVSATSHASAADKSGYVVACTPSNHYPMGTGAVVLGFVLGSRGSYFFLEPEHANALMPGKRPRNTITPSMALKDGKPFMAYGTPMGDGQCQSLSQFLVNIVDFGMNVQEAMEAPMWGSASFPGSTWPHTVLPGRLSLDKRIPDEVREALKAKGYGLGDIAPFGAQSISAIMIDPETRAFAAGAATKKDSQAIAW
jgi:gamma-glutamyltranspeptidase/glutathione hydrolase